MRSIGRVVWGAQDWNIRKVAWQYLDALLALWGVKRIPLPVSTMALNKISKKQLEAARG